MSGGQRGVGISKSFTWEGNNWWVLPEREIGRVCKRGGNQIKSHGRAGMVTRRGKKGVIQARGHSLTLRSARRSVKGLEGGKPWWKEMPYLYMKGK